MPFIVDPDHLRLFGLDLDAHRLNLPDGICLYALDRKKDAAMIERLRSMSDPHLTRQ
jgi:hypothetical protein